MFMDNHSPALISSPFSVPTAHPRSIGLIAGAVATGAVVLVVCIVLVAVALFYWKNKHKEEEEEEIPNEIR